MKTNKLDKNDDLLEYINSVIALAYEKLGTSEKGLTNHEADLRLKKFGYNEPNTKEDKNIALQFLAEFKNPLILLLVTIAIFSFFFGEKISAIIVVMMALLGTILSFIQEHKAERVVEKLIAMVHVTVSVYRDGKLFKIPLRNIVPGDIIELSAGAMVPADIRIISCNDLFINQSSLTGESFPVEKFADQHHNLGRLATDMQNFAFMGSSIVSGTGLGLVVKTGSDTQFGKLSQELSSINNETSFDVGIKQFTKMMIRLIGFLTLFILFAIIFIKHNSLAEALIFSLAVAVGLAPEMLPMLVTVNLAKGAGSMAKKDVIIKRLDSIQNVGAMNILCTDKTGTLTLDSIVLVKHCDAAGQEDEDVLRYAFINSYHQTGLNNLLDKAILKHKHLMIKEYKKVDEIPFDFQRRIVSVVVNDLGKFQLISKGAPEDIFYRCDRYFLHGKVHKINKKLVDEMNDEYNRLSEDGFRVLALAYKDVEDRKSFSKADETGLIFKGFAAFLDPPKPSTAEVISELKQLGVELKILSGDNERVTAKICSEVNLDIKGMKTGGEIDKMTDKGLKEVAKLTTVFARLNPMQKERVIKALQAGHNTVGFLGDGINDAPALKGADVGISVNNAADVAKDTADIIFLKKDLTVLRDCVIEGRKTFGNIIKYIKMGASSNFGNMFSMTGASIFLPFLPMTAVQIILNNFLYDISQIAIPTDNVDDDYVNAPRPWNIDFIKKFMLIIGPISSIYDFATFGVLWYVFNAQPELFHTGWFTESLLTQTLIIHIIRTSKVPFFQSRASKALTWTSLIVVSIGLILPYTPLAKSLGFVPLPAFFYVILAIFVVTYLLLVQAVKKIFIKKYGYQ